MTWMIGIDEAGYGPNLGPLVVAATAWQVEQGTEVRGQRSGSEKGSALAPAATPVDLYTRLAKIVSQKPSQNHLAIADSKLLYKPRGGLQWLEQAVLIGLEAGCDKSPTHWQQLWNATLADPAGRRHRLPWYAGYDCPLPIDSDADELTNLQSKFLSACSEASAELFDLRARAVFPGEFNDLTNHYGTKGAALSHVSIALVRDVLNNLPTVHSPLPTTFITCDKHGGRNRYAALLQHHFPDQFIEILQESRPASRYQWGPPERRINITFRTRGEAELPAALASMTAKYHRELAMQAFNAFWKEKIPGLRPTAGYPVDAKRFKAEIASKQRDLNIADHDLWRDR